MGSWFPRRDCLGSELVGEFKGMVCSLILWALSPKISSVSSNVPSDICRSVNTVWHPDATCHLSSVFGSFNFCAYKAWEPLS